VRGLAAQGDEAALRDLVTVLVARARIVSRVPQNKSRRLRAAVEWTPRMQLLLDAGLLTLGPDVQRPNYPATPKERRQGYLRYAACKKAGLVGVVPPARSGLAVLQ
jgi:hypothetical protein